MDLFIKDVKTNERLTFTLEKFSQFIPTIGSRIDLSQRVNKYLVGRVVDVEYLFKDNNQIEVTLIVEFFPQELK